jgi:hypothetical protein
LGAHFLKRNTFCWNQRFPEKYGIDFHPRNIRKSGSPLLYRLARKILVLVDGMISDDWLVAS